MRYLLLVILPVTLWAQSPPDDLESEIVLTEEQIEQPAFLKFDGRGRLWVAEFRTYPEPAGAKMKSRDRYWRAVYDKLPSPPGYPDYHPGKDRITIHEDTNGDGKYDRHSTFLDQLNLCTSFEFGPEGVYVLHPPYLLYYTDKNHDDKPDGPPEVLLEGFGIEDTHALVSSLTWGPDGWLYGSQGSTVSSRVKIPGSDQPTVNRIGQLMWRYHPERKKYEVFAEGGGNLWSCEFDSKGRLFSGHNGSTPGSYYLPGAYYAKTFRKHGELSNQYAYGHLPSIDHPGWKRLSTNVAVYEGGHLPERFNGSLLWANTLQHKVGASTLTPKGLNFKSEYLDPLLVGGAPLFRPVYIEPGPDGAVYVADWRDKQVNHMKNHQGEINKADGRVYRIQKKGTQHTALPDFRKLTTKQLVEQLRSPNRWTREIARQILWSRPDRNELLKPLLQSSNPQDALEALWSMERTNTNQLLKALKNSDEHVRAWAVRLLFDSFQGQWLNEENVAKLSEDSSLEVKAQLIAGLRAHSSPLFWTAMSKLLQNDSKSSNEQLTQLYWWAIESRAINFPDEAVNLLSQGRNPTTQKMAAYLARRLISEDHEQRSQYCLLLYQKSPKSLHPTLTKSVSRALTPSTNVPPELARYLIDSGENSLALKIRLNDPNALAEGLSFLKDPKTSSSKLLDIIPVISTPDAEPLFVTLAGHKDPSVARAALNALFPYSSPATGKILVDKFNTFPTELQNLAASLLTSRPNWAVLWIGKIKEGTIATSHLTSLIRESLPDHLLENLPTGEVNDSDKEIERITTVLKTTSGDPQAGRLLYLERCGTCHHLYNEGGNIGPDLTSYQRNSLPDLLYSTINPSAEIREGFQTITLRTKNNQTISGFLTRMSRDSITIRPLGGADQSIDRADITSQQSSATSLMPAGLLSDLSDKQLRDLFTYLGTSQPLNLKK